MQVGTSQEACKLLFPVFDVQEYLQKLGLNLTTGLGLINRHYHQLQLGIFTADLISLADYNLHVF